MELELNWWKEMQNFLIKIFIMFIRLLLSICTHMWKPEDNLCQSVLLSFCEF